MNVDSVGKSLLRSSLVERMCRAFGVDVRQYRLLIGLFSTLGDRMEFMGAPIKSHFLHGFLVFLSIAVSLFALAPVSLSGYLRLTLGMNMFFLALVVGGEAAQRIMNPDEASILAHQPVSGPTYVAAKVTDLLWLTAALTSSLSLVPALAGLLLRDARWFYPITHLLAAYSSALFLTFLVCGVYGWLFRLIAPARVKSASLWIQFVIFFAGSVLAPAAGPFITRNGGGAWLRSSHMPWNWFVAIGAIGSSGPSAFVAPEAWAAFALTAAFLIVGLRGFRADYLARASDLMQGSAVPSRGGSGRKLLSGVVTRITGAPSGYGALAFMRIMVQRDWNFRRQGLPVLCYLVVLAFPVFHGIGVSPFVEGAFTIRSFSLMHVIPHVQGLMLALICGLVSYTAEPKGPAMFASLPVGRLGPFVRGIYGALWLPTLFFHLALLAPCTWFWGAAHGILFVSFSLALVSFYLSVTVFFIDGLPFSAKFKPSLASEQQSIIFFAAIPIIVMAALQWILFYDFYWVLAATIALAALAWGVGRFSLKALEGKVQASLAQLGFGTQQIFRESD